MLPTLSAADISVTNVWHFSTLAGIYFGHVGDMLVDMMLATCLRHACVTKFGHSKRHS